MGIEFRCFTENELLDLEQQKDLSAFATDFAILLGASVERTKCGLLGSWISEILPEQLIYIVNRSGNVVKSDLKRINTNTSTCVRVVTDSTYIGLGAEWKTINKENGNRLMTFGELPQRKIPQSSKLQEILSTLYQLNNLEYTGKIYKFNVYSKLMEFKEFVYMGRKYIAVDNNFKKTLKTINKIKKVNNNSVFTDGVKASEFNGTIFFEVEPIEWDVNSRFIAYTRKLLFSSFPISVDFDQPNEFRLTNLYRFLNKEFLENITPSNTQYQEINNLDIDIKKIDEISKIKQFVECDIPVFLHGTSGDGKSARVKQIDNDATIIYMRNMTPESLIGKSIVINNELVDIPPTWYLQLVDKCNNENDKLHILFFDELTNALPSIQSMAFNIVLDKEVNGKWKLPENVRIVAAGNEMDDSIAANELSAPLYGRFAHVNIETNVDNWCNWAVENNIHPMIIAFIMCYGNKVLKTEYTGVEPNADPRKWEMASKVLYITNNPYMIKGLVGEDLTKKFISFISLKTYKIKDILDNNTIYDINMPDEEKYLTACIMSNAEEENKDKIYEFIKQLGNGPIKLFEFLCRRQNYIYKEKRKILIR